MPIQISGGVTLNAGVVLSKGSGSSGGGGGSSPTNPLGLSGTYSYDTEFGYLVALSDIDVSTESFAMGSSSTNFSQGTTLGRYMADSDFSTVMTNATYITFALYNTSDLASTPTNLSSVAGAVFPKANICTTPNQVVFPTSSLSSYPATFGSGASTRKLYLHDESSGSNLSGLDYSIFMHRSAGQFKETAWSANASGSFLSSTANGFTLTQELSYPPGERSWDNYNALAIYVTNSSTQPVLT